MENIVNYQNNSCIFAKSIASTSFRVVPKKLQFLYNVNKGIVTLLRFNYAEIVWRLLGELCPLFCYSIFFNAQI